MLAITIDEPAVEAAVPTEGAEPAARFPGQPSRATWGSGPQAASYHREAARLARQAGDTVQLGRALLNLSDAVTSTAPAAGAEAARAAAAQLRRPAPATCSRSRSRTWPRRC